MRSTLAAVVLSAVIGFAGPAWGQQGQQTGTQGQQQPDQQYGQQQPAMRMMGQCQGNYQAAMKTLDSLETTLREARESNDAARMREALANAEQQFDRMRSDMNACSQAMQAYQGTMGPGMMGGGQGMMGGRPGMIGGQQGQPGMMGGQQGMMGGQQGMMGTTGMGGVNAFQFDPVCRARIAEGTAPTATYEGRTYHFCSEADKEAFLKEPAKYLAPTR